MAVFDEFGRIPEKFDFIADIGLMEGDFYLNVEKIADAKETYSQTVQWIEKNWGPVHPSYAYALLALGDTEEILGEKVQAEAHQRRAMDTLRTSYKRDLHFAMLGSMNRVASVYLFENRPQEAKRLYESKLEKLQQTFGPDHPILLETLIGLSSAHRALGNPETGIPVAKRALQILEVNAPKENLDRGKVLHLLASLWFDQGDMKQAVDLETEALQIYEKLKPFTPIEKARSLRILAAVHLKEGRLKEAEAAARESLSLLYSACWKYHPERAESFAQLAQISKAEGKAPQFQFYTQMASVIREGVFWHAAKTDR